jgi:hypothetical protein
MSDNLPEKIESSPIQTSPILQAALNPELDIEKIERLFALHEKALLREAEIKFYHDFSKVQEEIPPIRKTLFNKHTKSWYAPVDVVNAIIAPIYSKYGFSVTFRTEDSNKENHLMVWCEVSHKGGYVKKYPYDAPMEGKSMGGKSIMTPTHAKSSTLSYSQRYLLRLVFNLSFVEDDNDGNGDTISKEQIDKVTLLIKETGASLSGLLKYYNIKSLDQLPNDCYSGAISILEIKKSKAAASEGSIVKDRHWYTDQVDQADRAGDVESWWEDNKDQVANDLSKDDFAVVESTVRQTIAINQSS